MNLVVRTAVEEDLPGILHLVHELAHYEKAPEQVTATLDDYINSFRDGVFESIVAASDGQILGTCIFYTTFSTWRGNMLWLEDFVVSEKHRGLGIGQQLFDHFLKIAKERNSALVKWQVLDWNTPAQRFYERYDAIIEKEWWNCKIMFVQ